MLVAMVFVMLTADLEFARFAALDYRGILLVAAVLFLTRPASILISTIGSDVEWKDRLLLAWIAPRGIVAAATAGVMAPKLAEQGFSGADA
jgi:NhaP-type Na+/H+ or K+/H+ antiporter